MERNDCASLIEGMEDQADGMYVWTLTYTHLLCIIYYKKYSLIYDLTWRRTDAGNCTCWSLSSLSKTGTSNIETPHSLPFKIPSCCAASFVAQIYSSSNTTIVDVTRSITSQLVHTYNFTIFTRAIVIENNFKICAWMFVWTKMFIFICIKKYLTFLWD